MVLYSGIKLVKMRVRDGGQLCMILEGRKIKEVEIERGSGCWAELVEGRRERE